MFSTLNKLSASAYMVSNSKPVSLEIFFAAQTSIALVKASVSKSVQSKSMK
jgi:hypothetical protein